MQLLVTKYPMRFMMQHSSSVNHCPFNCKADYHLTNNQESINLYYPVKRKQALLGSNLSGIAGAEKSQEDGTRSSDRVPTHHFGQYLRKPKKLSAILGLDTLFSLSSFLFPLSSFLFSLSSFTLCSPFFNQPFFLVSSFKPPAYYKHPFSYSALSKVTAK